MNLIWKRFVNWITGITAPNPPVAVVTADANTASTVMAVAPVVAAEPVKKAERKSKTLKATVNGVVPEKKTRTSRKKIAATDNSNLQT